MIRVLCSLIIVALLASCGEKTELILSSLSSNVNVKLENSTEGLFFNLTNNGHSVIAKSPLGLKINNEDFHSSISIKPTFDTVVVENWVAANEMSSTVENNYHEYHFEVSKNSTDLFKLVFRMYEDGFAYRYVFENLSETQNVNIDKELTVLHFENDYTYWAYNEEQKPLGPIVRSEQVIAPVLMPMVVKLADDNYLAIHESDMAEFAPLSINATADDNSLSFITQYTERSQAFSTSWRTFIVGKKIGDLLESNMIANLNEPSKIDDLSWIKPGKSMWDWRVWGYKAKDGFEYGLNTISHKRLIDFAAKNNIQYLLIDADWYGEEFSAESDPTTAREGVNIEECMTHAKKRGVGVILYLNDKGAKLFGLEKVLKQFADWGAVGVKYGFMRGTEEEKVKHTRKVMELCAQNKLMVIFHDKMIPLNGDRRTWPNMMAKEFCHAQADAHRSAYPETAVNTALINMIAGPIDATNGWFDLNHAQSRPRVFAKLPGTVAGEVAKLIVMHTGWMVLPDAPESYLSKDDIFDCIRKMPAKFDSFKVLDAELDHYVTVARAAGEDYFVGTITDRASRDLSIDLSFLPKEKKYEATVYEDAPDTHFLKNKESYQVRHIGLVDSSSKINAVIASGGGHSIYLKVVQ